MPKSSAVMSSAFMRSAAESVDVSSSVNEKNEVAFMAMEGVAGIDRSYSSPYGTTLATANDELQSVHIVQRGDFVSFCFSKNSPE